MSFILDALKKLERSRVRGPVPRLELPAAEPTPAARPQWLPWACAALALSVAIGVLVWRATEPAVPVAVAEADAPKKMAKVVEPVKRAVIKPKPTPQPKPQQNATRDPLAGAAVPADKPVQAATAVLPAPKTVAPAPTVLPTPAVEPKPIEPVVALRTPPGERPVVPVPAEVLGPASEPKEKFLRPEPTKVQRNPPKAAPAPASEPAEEEASPEAGASDAPAQDEPKIPTLEELSPDVQAIVPKLKISILAYASGTADRMAYINGQKYVEGQLVDGKVKVEAIVRQGVVLSVQGQRFLLRP